MTHQKSLENGQGPMSKGLRCPLCGSAAAPKGYVEKKAIGWVRQYQCKDKDCRHRFTMVSCRRWKSSKLPHDLLKLYLSHTLKETKEEIERSLNLRISTATILSEIKRRSVIDWRAILWDMDLRKRWGLVLGVDTTEIKVSGKPYIYLHVVDVQSRIPLAYEVLPNRNAEGIKDILRHIRSAGYTPRLIVTDLAPELLEAIEKIYPGVPVQGCLFHLKEWLNEELPTKRRKVHPKTFQTWITVKKIIMHVAMAYTKDKQKILVDKLLEMYPSLDERAKDVVRLFVNSWLRYYHPMRELEELGCSRKHAYNNVCERHMEEVKELERRMRGFKNLEMTRKCIYALWYYKIQNKKSEFILSAEGTSLDHDTSEEPLDISLLIFMPQDILDLEEISETTETSIELLKKLLEKQGLVVTAKYAFTKEYAEGIVKQILRDRSCNLKEAMKLTGLDPYTLASILGKFGIKIVLKTLCVEEAAIIYPDHKLTHPDDQSGHD